MTGWRGVCVVMVLTLVALSAPRAGTAQLALSVSGGAAPYDLSGTGTSGVVAARADLDLNSTLSIEGGASYFWYTTQGDTGVGMLLPEVGVFAHAPASFPIYLGAGVGHSLGVRGDPFDSVTLFGALGLELGDRNGWSVRPEMRVRSVDPWVGTIVEFTMGVQRRVGT